MAKRARPQAANPGLRSKYLRLMGRIGKIAAQYHHRFSKLSESQLEDPRPPREGNAADDRYAAEADGGQDYEPRVEEWESIREKLRSFQKRTSRAVGQYDSLKVEIEASNDEFLKEQVRLADASRIRSLLESMDESLADQLREAQAPLSDTEIKDFWNSVRNGVCKARLLYRVAEKLRDDLESSAADRNPDHTKTIVTVRSTLGGIMLACVDLAESCRPARSATGRRQFEEVVTAFEKHEENLESLGKELALRANDLRKQGDSASVKKVEDFAARLENEMCFGSAAIETSVMSISAAVRLPKAADQAADKLLRKIRDVQKLKAILAAECSVARGGTNRRGDLEDVEAIRPYGKLSPREQGVVAFFLDRMRAEGFSTTADIKEIIAGFRSYFDSNRSGGGDTSIKNAVRDLVNEGILIPDKPVKDRKGHGGRIGYRLSVPASEAYMPWWNAANPGESQPTDTAVSTASDPRTGA